MGEMKSAWQIAMEKAEKLGKVTPEELNSIKYEPEGNRIASRYLTEDKYDMPAEMSKYAEAGALAAVKKGMEEIFIRSIVLPHHEADQARDKKAMLGLKFIKEDKKQLDGMINLVNNLFNQYQVALQQTYAEFKKKAEVTIQQAGRNMAQNRGGNQMSAEQQLQLQLQEEWRQISNQLDSQYEKVLDDHKNKIRQIK